MCEAFPRVASCTFWKFGSGGEPVGHQALCIMSLNIIIDKVYLVLWFWYVIIGTLGCIRVICRVFQLASRHIRFWLMKIKMHRYKKFHSATVMSLSATLSLCNSVHSVYLPLCHSCQSNVNN